jgi:hypothetical protein
MIKTGLLIVHADKVLATKLIAMMLSVFTSGSIVGLCMAREAKSNRAQIDSRMFLAATTSPRLNIVPEISAVSQSQALTVALSVERIEQLSRENQVSIDDRKLLHDDLAKEQDREVSHYNSLLTRLDVDEAQLFLLFKVGGTIWGLLSAVPAIISFLEFKSKRKAQM